MQRFAQVAAARSAPACRSGICSALLPRATSCAGAVVLTNGRGGALGAAPLRVPAWQRSNFVGLAGQGHASPVRRAEGLRAMAIARDMTEDEVTYRFASVLHRPPQAKPDTHSAGCSSAGFLPPSLPLPLCSTTTLPTSYSTTFSRSSRSPPLIPYVLRLRDKLQ